MSKVITFRCDRCGNNVPETAVVAVDINNNKGKFSLADEHFDLCASCAKATIDWIRTRNR